MKMRMVADLRRFIQESGMLYAPSGRKGSVCPSDREQKTEYTRFFS
jgi:hypothetical protein